MILLAREPECVAMREGLVEIRLCFEGLAEQGVVACGIRSRSGEHIAQGNVIVPGACVHVDLEDRPFEHGEELELAVKENGYSTPEAPQWSKMGWSWTGRYRAALVDGKPLLEALG